MAIFRLKFSGGALEALPTEVMRNSDGSEKVYSFHLPRDSTSADLGEEVRKQWPLLRSWKLTLDHPDEIEVLRTHEPIPQRVQESVWPMVVFINPIKHKTKHDPQTKKKMEHKVEPNPQMEPNRDVAEKEMRKYTTWTMRKEFAMPPQEDGTILHVRKSRKVYPEEYLGRYIGRSSLA